MCVNTSVVPLVRLKDGKRKLLFQYTLKKEDIEDIESLSSFRNEFNRAIYQVKHNLCTDERTQVFSKIIKNNLVSEFDSFVSVPCGHCSECLKVNARNWAIRILEEAKQYEHNYFITLTYDSRFLPKYGSLVKDEISKFNKKLRSNLYRAGLNSQFRMYGVGEYGEKFMRPHYHIIYFNLDLPDLKFERYSDEGFPCYSSKFLQHVWSREILIDNEKKMVPVGIVDIQEVSIGSACYVARYCDKKRNMTREDLDNLKLFNLIPEFSVMSRKPGIGANYFSQVVQNVLNGAYKITYKDNQFSIPKYYKNKLNDILNESELEDFKKYNSLVSDNLAYKYLQLPIDINDYFIYTEYSKKLHRRKRDFEK